MDRRNFLIGVLLPLAACNSSRQPAIELSPRHDIIVSAADSININTASFEDLQRIPHVGASMAEKIIEHREKYGPFKRPEHLMLIQGMSDIRFRRIQHLIRVE